MRGTTAWNRLHQGPVSATWVTALDERKAILQQFLMGCAPPSRRENGAVPPVTSY
jgi:hypothetical protein